MDDGNNNWTRITNAYLSVSWGGNNNDTDGYYTTPLDILSGPVTNLAPQVTGGSVTKGDVRFPSSQIWGNSNDTFNNVPSITSYNETWILKLSKSAFWDDRHHETNFVWYCTGIVGPYQWPLGF